MNVFNKYADFYDLLYEDKDYWEECNFVRSILERYGRGKASTILDFGCGTGSHALFFADMGYTVTGVDFSEKMLRIAREKAARQEKHIPFLRQDIRHLNLPQKFDAVVSMFAAMGYQTTNRDFEDAILSVHRHLNPGGLFIFDVWFGPAVLSQRPSDRVKTIEHGGGKIIRYAHPVLDIMSQTVEVNFTVVEAAGEKPVSETKESHLMRFFFYQELGYFLEKSGLEILRVCPFMDFDGKVDENTWNISVIAAKKGS